jgi:cytochrome c553
LVKVEVPARMAAKIFPQVLQLSCRLLVAIGALLVANISAAAPDVAAGQARAAVCHNCHGAEGVSSNPAWPNLAGQKSRYLVKQLKAFREGTREDSTMTLMAKPLTDEDIENIAAYYASLADTTEFDAAN